MSMKPSAFKLKQYQVVPDTMRGDPSYPIFEAGVKHGEVETMKFVLSYLEHDLISDPQRPDKGTPEYDAILEVARNLARRLRED